ncbi:MAG: FtsX-like permease family protein [Anaerolineae bacterium]|nr:FtsX-like permease family protein [Anaerolineae bacterium]
MRAADSLDNLALRNLDQDRQRTMLSATAVALGVATVISADVVRGSLIHSLAGLQDAQSFMLGLLDQLGAMLEWIGGGIVLAAGFMVWNTFAMSVTRQRQQIGMLRTLGLTRRQVMRLMLVEALVVGMLGVLIGLLAGPILGYATIGIIQGIVGEDVFVFTIVSASSFSLLLAVVLGLAVTLLSVLLPAWQATRIVPLAALHNRSDARGRIVERASRRRGLFALVSGGVAAAVALYLAVAPPGRWVQPPWDVPLAIVFVLAWLGCLGGLVPAVIGGMGWAAQGLAPRLAGVTGRLVADNLRRNRGRVTVTVLTLGIALTMIVGTTGFIRFTWHELLQPRIALGLERRAWLIAPFDINAGMSAYVDMESIQLSPDTLAGIHRGMAGWGQVIEMHYVIVPELSFFGRSYFSFVADPQRVRDGGEWLFAFTEGDWETALPVMESGCGVLITPLIAGRNGVELGDTFSVSGANGAVECTVAGIGASMVNASIIGIAAGDAFGITAPVSAGVWPLPGVDPDEFAARLQALVDGMLGVEAAELEKLLELQTQVVDMLPQVLSAISVLAVVTAALGVVNATVVSIAERRRELGLLRAVGATRRQVRAVVAGEAALMGLCGGLLGMVAGAGITVIVAVVYGGNGWGVPDLELWPAAWRSLQPALGNGLVGLVATPFVAALASRPPVRSILGRAVVDVLRGEQ